MRILIKIIYLIIFFSACKNEEKKVITAQETESVSVLKDSISAIVYTLDTTASKIGWEGYEGLSLGKSEHNGSLKIKDGHLGFKDSSLVSGKFVIDLNSLTVEDIPVNKPGNAKLKKHLLGADFFDAEKYPVAIFEITKAEKTKSDSLSISGNLSLKGITKNITIPALVKISDNQVMATTPKFYIHRKDWGMHYRNDNSLGDEMIRNEIGITIDIIAKR
jgi:polyisoprenoid-binding protein YceI